MGANINSVVKRDSLGEQITLILERSFPLWLMTWCLTSSSVFLSEL